MTATPMSLGLILTGMLAIGWGCGRPSAVNIELRKEKQALEARVAELEQDLGVARARIVGLQDRIGTVPTLPEERLANLFTIHDIQIGRLTGGADLGRDGGADEGLKLYLTPLDAAGKALKATGELTVSAFDLNGDQPQRIGEWTFTPAQLKDAWVDFGPIEAFVLELPWQQVPETRDLALRITFQDALTGRVFSETTQVRAKLPPAATEAAAQP